MNLNIVRNTSSNPEAKKIIKNLQEFTKSAEFVSSNHSRLLEEYPSQWIGVYRQKVEAHAEDLDQLLDLLDKKGIPLGDTVIRFLNEERETLIL